MKIKSLFIFLLTCCWAIQFVQGREIEVKEVTISLYSRPVNGYRLVLDRRMSSVTNQILRHVSSKGVGSPFQYEHTIIYENIRYAPITTDREISLYFLVRTVESQFTELTFVGMYDYKRSINPREFPDLSDNMLEDLASLVRRITGDDLRFSDRIYVEGQKGLAVKDTAKSAPVEHFREEEVENNSVLVKTDPFAKKTASPLEAARAENTTLRDSVRRLNREITDMKKRFVNADEVSVGNAPSEQMAELRRELEVAKSRTTVYQRRNDSLIQSNRDVMAKIEQLGQEEAKYKPQIEELRRENTRLIGEVNDLRVRAGEKPIPGVGTSVRVAQLEEALGKEIEETRRLNAKIVQLTTDKAELSSLLEKRGEEMTILRARIAAAEKSASLPQTTRDSLKLLLVRAEKANQLAEENERLNRLLESKGDNDSKLLREMQSMQARNATLIEERNSLEKENVELKESLTSTLGTLSELNEKSKALLDQHALMEKRILAQQDALSQLEGVARKSQAEVSMLEDSIRKQNEVQRQLQTDLGRKENELSARRIENDSTQARLNRANMQNKSAEMRILNLQNQIDSLSVRTEPVDDQARFIREQWTKLENWNRELDARKKAQEDKEKLLNRREEVLKQREGQVGDVSDREKQLQERENALKTAEQRGKTQNGFTEEVEITRSNLNERGAYVPVFEVKSARSYKGAQQLVAAYMNNRGLLFDEKFPDMLFDGVILPEISNSPVTLRLRIEAFGTGSIIRVSVRYRDGKYISEPGQESAAPKVEQFLKEMFRFAN